MFSIIDICNVDETEGVAILRMDNDPVRRDVDPANFGNITPIRTTIKCPGCEAY